MTCDVDCYRVNYSKDWLAKSNDSYHIDGFPCYGAVTAINLLCDEVVALRKEVEQRADNISRDEIGADIIESRIVCDYCKVKDRSGRKCPHVDENIGVCFVGRKLRPC